MSVPDPMIHFRIPPYRGKRWCGARNMQQSYLQPLNMPSACILVRLVIFDRYSESFETQMVNKGRTALASTITRFLGDN